MHPHWGALQKTRKQSIHTRLGISTGHPLSSILEGAAPFLYKSCPMFPSIIRRNYRTLAFHHSSVRPQSYFALRIRTTQTTVTMQFTLYAFLFAGLAATGLAGPQTEIGSSGCYIRPATEDNCSPLFPRQCAGSSGTNVFPFCCKETVEWC